MLKKGYANNGMGFYKKNSNFFLPFLVNWRINKKTSPPNKSSPAEEATPTAAYISMPALTDISCTEST